MAVSTKTETRLPTQFIINVGKRKNMGVSSFSAIFLSPKISCTLLLKYFLDCQFFLGCESLRSGKDSGTTRLVNNITDLSYGPIYSRINFCCSEFQQDHLRIKVAPVIEQSSEVYGSFRIIDHRVQKILMTLPPPPPPPLFDLRRSSEVFSVSSESYLSSF